AEPTPASALALRTALAELKKASAPYDAWLRVFRRARHPRAARWIATTRVAVARAEEGSPPAARRELGEARRALRDPEQLQPALDRLLVALDS
ncbi:MAG TPA: hypothetical protein VN759_13240, partial [Pseudolysinimonas sp.]|nr:hypothetical protein [Pseudolysinimonas sp.]